MKVEGILVETNDQAKLKGALPESWSVESLRGSKTVFLASPSESELALDQAWEWTHKLESLPDVEIAEPSLVTAGLEPADLEKELAGHEEARSGGGDDDHLPGTSDHHWAPKLIHMPEAWEFVNTSGGGAGKDGEGIRVAHPDTGYTENTQIFNARLLHGDGYNFFDGHSDPKDPLTGDHPGHGTSTGSLIMSSSRVATDPVWGTAPKCDLIPLRVMDNVVRFNFKTVTESIIHAHSNNCHVISMSLGGPTSPHTLEREIDAAVKKGLIVLAAAGNVWPWVVYPAKFEQVIAVAACNAHALRDPENGIWSGSATGRSVDFSAPGESVWRARRDAQTNEDRVERGNGTSFAVATTAGVACVWLAFHGRGALIDKFGAENIQELFRYMVKNHGVDTPNGWDTRKWGSGVLNAEKLLKAPLPSLQQISTTRTLPPEGAERLLEFYEGTGINQQTVLTNTRQFFNVTEETEGQFFEQFGDEIAMQFATNSQLREAMVTGNEAPTDSFSSQLRSKI